MSTILFTVPWPSHLYLLLPNKSKWHFWRNSSNNFLIVTKQSTCWRFSQSCLQSPGSQSSKRCLRYYYSPEESALQPLCPSAFKRDLTHFVTLPYHHNTQKLPFSLNRALNSAATQPGPATAPYTAFTYILVFINRAMYFLLDMLLLHTGHGTIKLLAKQTSQIYSVKTKRVVVIVQCCAQKCFFPALYCTLGTASVLTHGEPRTMRWHCCYYPSVWGAGWRHRSIPKKTTWWHGYGRRQFTPLSQQPWDNRALGLG